MPIATKLVELFQKSPFFKFLWLLVPSLSCNFSVFCCCSCQLFSSLPAPAWLTDTKELLLEPHLVALPEVVLLLVIGVVAFLISRLDPVPVTFFSSKATLIFAPNFLGGFFSLLSPFYLPHKWSLITELYWPIKCSTVCCSCLCRLIFSSHSPLEAIVSLHLFHIKSFSSMCFHSQNAI